MRNSRRCAPSFLTFLVLLALGVGCDSPATHRVVGPDDTTDESHLLQHWLRSYEEEDPQDTVQIFRPADSREFPPSWFRMAYVFHDGGDLDWLYLHPADGHHMRPGSWEFDPLVRPVLHLDQDGVRSFALVELGPDLLRLEPLSTP